MDHERPYIPAAHPDLRPGEEARLSLVGWNLQPGDLRRRRDDPHRRRLPGGDRRDPRARPADRGGAGGPDRIAAGFRPPRLAPGATTHPPVTLTDPTGAIPDQHGRVHRPTRRRRVALSAPAETRVWLRPGRDKSVREGHPWIFSGAVGRPGGSGGRARRAGLRRRRPAARARLPQPALADPRPPARRRGEGGPRLLRRRLAEARPAPRSCPPDTTGYRVLNAEGDGVPGWTVDRFGDVLVSQITVAGLEALRDEAYAALAEAFPGLSILQSTTCRRGGPRGCPRRTRRSPGEPPAEAPFLESGLELHGRAGGRPEDRLLLRPAGKPPPGRGAWPAGRTVLDLFAHTGAFGLYALRGGAARVVHVESSARLIERGRGPTSATASRRPRRVGQGQRLRGPAASGPRATAWWSAIRRRWCASGRTSTPRPAPTRT